MQQEAFMPIQRLKQTGYTVATAESCTGGLLAVWLTDLPGSSDWFDRGWVVYSNGSKTTELGVDERVIDKHGPVSESVVMAMCVGAHEKSNADITLATTGLAGPGGDGSLLSVGTVWVACHFKGQTHTRMLEIPGDRKAVREQAAVAVLALMAEIISQ